MQRTAVVTLLLVMSVMPAAYARTSRVQNVTVSDLAKAPQRFNGKMVRVDACAITSMHGTMLFDCATSGDYGVALRVRPARNTKDADALFDESFGPEAASHKRRVSAIIAGRFQWIPNGHPNAIIDLKTISGVTVNEP
jgi:hypothetical protein